MGIPHPGCFLQEWQTKDLSLTRVNFASIGIKKLSEEWLIVEDLKLKEQE